MYRPRVWHSKTIITLLPAFLSDTLGKVIKPTFIYTIDHKEERRGG